jgi:hypothetical protein
MNPEKWHPDFGKDHAPSVQCMIPNGTRLSEKIMLQANIYALAGI